MALTIDMRVAELLMARLCHDFAGPIAAIGNGAELLDDDDPGFVKQAAALIGDSAETAAKRLQFFRFVFGFNAGAMAGPAPHTLASEYLRGAIACEYPETAKQLEVPLQRLACALLLVASEALPRGGKLTVTAGPTITAAGEGTGPSAEARDALTLTAPVEALSSRTIGAYFAGLLARGLGRRVNVGVEPGGFRLSCEPDAT
ncbi:MAG TPA: histidine phosphotransferase family protein [Stellaceae bacterium]|nr:histidine phosphotransferase family protein [Stellaceae bacterium]